MPLRLVTGPANSGKTGIVLAEALEAAAAGASPIITVPNPADVRRLESELSGKAPLGVRVMTLPQLLADLWSQHGDGRRLVDDVTRDALLERLVRQGVDESIEQASQAPGFITLLSRVARESGATAREATTSDAASGAIRRLIDAYRHELAEAGRVEPRWLGTLLGEVAPRLGGPIGAARFDALSTYQVEALVGLARHNEVTVALTWEHMFAPTRANDDAVAYLATVAKEHLKLAELPVADEIQALSRALYTGPAQIEGGGMVTTALASGAEAEAALVARFAANELTAGVPAERILVAFPRAHRRAGDVERALLSEGISADFDVATPLKGTRLGRAWRALLSLGSLTGGRAEALAYLASPYSGAAPQAVHGLDRRWRSDQVSDPAALLRGIGRIGDACSAASEAVRRIASQGLTAANLCVWQELADAMLAASLECDSATAVGRAAAQDASAHQALGRLVSKMSPRGKGRVDVSAVLAASAGINVREAGAESVGRVQVSDFASVGARRFDVVILGGLTDNELSVAPPEGVEEELRSSLARNLDGDSADRLRLRFYSLITRARSRLYLVRQEADSEGRERRASALWEDVIDAYRPSSAPFDDCAPEALPCVRMSRSDIENLAPALTVSRRSMRQGAARLDLGTVDRGTITSADGLSALARDRVFSATEIEAYLECPYRWFYDRIVRPEQIDRTMDARELGSQAHGLLAEFYGRIAEASDEGRVTPDSIHRALELFDDIATSRRVSISASAGLADELNVARAVAWARSVVNQDATLLPGFVPEFIESAFGYLEPFSFAGHAFRGRIDRIDTCATGVFVMDYKSSRDVPGLSKFETDAKVQAVIYACAAGESLGRPALGSVYRSLRSGRLRGFWRSDLVGEIPQGACEDDAVDAAGFASLVARTEQRVDDAIAGMRQGRVPRAPAVKGACTYCTLSATCEGARA